MFPLRVGTFWVYREGDYSETMIVKRVFEDRIVKHIQINGRMFAVLRRFVKLPKEVDETDFILLTTDSSGQIWGTPPINDDWSQAEMEKIANRSCRLFYPNSDSLSKSWNVRTDDIGKFAYEAQYDLVSVTDTVQLLDTLLYGCYRLNTYIGGHPTSKIFYKKGIGVVKDDREAWRRQLIERGYRP
jgi:hypothetical protein